ERTRLGPALDERSIAPVHRQHVLAAVDADDAWQREEADRILQRYGIRAHRREQRRRPRLLVRTLRQLLGHVRPVAAAAQEDGPTGLRVEAELAGVAGGGEQLLGALGGELVRDDVLRQGGAGLAALQIRPVAADPYD